MCNAPPRPAAGLYAPDRGTMLVEVAPGHGKADICNLRTDANNRITIRGDSIGINVNWNFFGANVDPTSTVYLVAWHGARFAAITDKTPLKIVDGQMGAPVVDKFVLVGDLQDTKNCFNGSILMFAHFPTRLHDAILQELVK